jgi:hypothetical protein
MPSVSSNNESHLAEMSQITRQKQRYDHADEARFLRQQANDAQIAIKQTLAQMRKTSKDAADVRWWTQRYPWCAVGGAGLLGFVVVTYLSAFPCGQERSSPQRHARESSPSSVFSGMFSSVFSGMFSSLLSIGRGGLMSAIIGDLQTHDEEPATDHQASAASPSYQEH